LSSPFIDGVFDQALPPACASGGAALVYFIEFGVFAVGPPTCSGGSAGAARAAARSRAPVTISALGRLWSSASFFRPPSVNNDSAWRIILFTQLATLLWSVAALAPARNGRSSRCTQRLPRAGAAGRHALLLGIAVSSTTWSALRAFQPSVAALSVGGERVSLRRDPQVIGSFAPPRMDGGQYRPTSRRAAQPPMWRAPSPMGCTVARASPVSDVQRAPVRRRSNRRDVSGMRICAASCGRHLPAEADAASRPQPRVDRRGHGKAIPIWNDRPHGFGRPHRSIASPHVRVVPVRGAGPWTAASQ